MVRWRGGAKASLVQLLERVLRGLAALLVFPFLLLGWVIGTIWMQALGLSRLPNG
jgi:hypothetical protein